MARVAKLGDRAVLLQGQVPTDGQRLTAEFVIPAARVADTPLTAAALRCGLVVVSTLPNIQKHACLEQIVDLEELGHTWLPGLRIVHVSADHEEHWKEVDRFHPDIRSEGYSLCCADPASREAFMLAFGVGVENHRRIAHGLFALLNGRVVAAEVPEDQMKPASVRVFVERVAALVGGSAERQQAS